MPYLDINVNAIDENGRTPLFLAAWNGNAEIAKELMHTADVDLNKSDYEGWTPLQAASHRYAVLEILIGRSQSFTTKSSLYWT